MTATEKAKQLILTIIQNIDSEILKLQSNLHGKMATREGLQIAIDKINQAEKECTHEG